MRKGWTNCRLFFYSMDNVVDSTDITGRVQFVFCSLISYVPSAHKILALSYVTRKRLRVQVLGEDVMSHFDSNSTRIALPLDLALYKFLLLMY